MGVPILTVYDNNGNEISIPAIQGRAGNTGPQGPAGATGPRGVSGVYVGTGTIPEGYNVKINPNGGVAELIEEAPNDGKQYARKNKAWTEITGGSSSRWTGKNILVIGDSASDPPYGPQYEGQDIPWQTTLASELGVNITTHALAGATLIDMVDGATIAETGGTIGPLTQQDVTGKDLIILFGGPNDRILRGKPWGIVGEAAGTSTIAASQAYAFNKIYTLLEAAGNITCRVMAIAIYCVGPSYLNQDDEDGYDKDFERLTQLLEDGAHYLGIPCCNLYKISGINRYTWDTYTHTTDLDDGLHLNSLGNALIGKQIARFIESEV